MGRWLEELHKKTQILPTKELTKLTEASEPISAEEMALTLDCDYQDVFEYITELMAAGYPIAIGKGLSRCTHGYHLRRQALSAPRAGRLRRFRNCEKPGSVNPIASVSF